MTTLNIKDKIAYLFAAISLLVGFSLTIAGFIVNPLGVIDNSVLWVLGQTLTFAGAVCGISLHVRGTKEELKHEILHEMRK